MKAIQMQGYGGVDQLWYEDVPAPTAGPDRRTGYIGRLDRDRFD
jgi:hypothetical protein